MYYGWYCPLCGYTFVDSTSYVPICNHPRCKNFGSHSMVRVGPMSVYNDVKNLAIACFEDHQKQKLLVATSTHPSLHRPPQEAAGARPMIVDDASGIARRMKELGLD